MNSDVECVDQSLRFRLKSTIKSEMLWKSISHHYYLKIIIHSWPFDPSKATLNYIYSEDIFFFFGRCAMIEIWHKIMNQIKICFYGKQTRRENKTKKTEVDHFNSTWSWTRQFFFFGFYLFSAARVSFWESLVIPCKNYKIAFGWVRVRWTRFKKCTTL